MNFHERLQRAQLSLAKEGVDGWLLYDFRKTNDLACRFLEISMDQMLTRRLFYWIPRHGSPIKLVHRIENKSLDQLPGTILEYRTWKELQQCLQKILKGSKKAAMEYSPCNAIPYVSKVDGGTIDLIRSLNVEVVSSANLLQAFTSVWDDLQLESHLAALRVLEKAVDHAWDFIASSIRQKRTVTEMDVQHLILEEFKKNDCISEDPPMCAVNEHSADPHYCLNPRDATIIKAGDFVLIDLWCKKKSSRAVYADITRVGVVDSHPSVKQQEIFDIVKGARDAAMELLASRFTQGRPIMGWEVDCACRQKIEEAGYGEYFTHRTGHNIGERVHGDGANIDNFETKDDRFLLPSTCFSVEPGIYLPGEFGIRLEHDVYVEPDGRTIRATGKLQNEIVCLFFT